MKKEKRKKEGKTEKFDPFSEITKQNKRFRLSIRTNIKFLKLLRENVLKIFVTFEIVIKFFLRDNGSTGIFSLAFQEVSFRHNRVYRAKKPRMRWSQAAGGHNSA